ncbi:pleckstrin domain containing protein [Reticulomyxa filosa]|uniref:Pleckstrin domain containing protein n=1 Tax=Reticulomyxa filosa TaxID=46433 RepID=X6NIC7_RETFI|nr:pleckstrin domain containing protein [Reticulomyxa filosa]|eukprot:ETO25459.1 pleckstrin domain containing protein [Reticulomyxa filosa]
MFSINGQTHSSCEPRNVESQGMGHNRFMTPTINSGESEYCNSDLASHDNNSDLHSHPKSKSTNWVSGTLFLHASCQKNGKCATCREQLTSNMLGRPKYHYCRYTGALHCDSCHQLEMAVIPHRVLQDLDCRPAKVCKAAKRYLDQMFDIPCISISMFNSDVIQKNRMLKDLSISLKQLEYMSKYVEICSNRERLEQTIGDLKRLLTLRGLLSLHDIVEVLLNDLGQRISKLCDIVGKHIIECGNCKSSAHQCSICKSTELLFEFQKTTFVCKCGEMCHHKCSELHRSQCSRTKKRLMFSTNPQSFYKPE